MSRYRQSFNEALIQVEKWSKDVEVKSTGEHKDKTVAQLEKEVEALRGKPNNEKEMGGLLFAIRAKQGWKKGEGSTGVGESTQIKHERGEVKPEKVERGERKAGESDDDYEDRESGGERGFRPDPKKKKKQDNDEAKESTLPPHLSKFLDKKGNPNKEAQARIDAGKKKREVAAKVKDVTPKGYGPSEQTDKPEQGKVTAKSVAHHDAQKKKPTVDSKAMASRLQDILKKQKERQSATKKEDMSKYYSDQKLGLEKPKIWNVKTKKFEEKEIDELSNELLGRYKKKSAAASSAAAKAGDHDKSHKRYKGVNTATSLQFRNDAKKHEEIEVDEQKPQHPGQKKGSAKLKKGWGMTPSGEPYFKPNSNNPTRDKKEDMSLAPKGKGRKAAKAMYGVKEDLEFKVRIKGIPPFYVPAKTAAAVKQSLRKQLKHPDDIESIVRVTKSAQRIDFRKRAQGKSDEDDNKK